MFGKWRKVVFGGLLVPFAAALIRGAPQVGLSRALR
jgi:hypothetical protein